MLRITEHVKQNRGRIESKVSVLAGANRMQIADLAREAKVSYEAARRQWDGTATRIDFATLAGLCDALNCQPGDLFRFVPDGNGTN